MWTTARPTFATSIGRLGLDRAVGLRHPAAIRSAISVAALPMSICPQAMSYSRPSSESDLVRPVMACLVAV